MSFNRPRAEFRPFLFKRAISVAVVGGLGNNIVHSRENAVNGEFVNHKGD